MEIKMEQKNDSIQNQELTRERKTYSISFDDKYKRIYVEKLLGLNSNSWKMLEEKGVIPLDATYNEVCTIILKYYQKAEAAKVEAIRLKAEANEGKRNYRNADTESGLPRIQEASIISKIRLDKAKEESIHLDNLAKKETFIDKNAQYELLSPIFIAIANELKGIVAEHPELTPTVDKCFTNLHRFGKIICEQVKLDGEEYVKHQMNKEIDLDEILQQGLLL